MSRTVPAPSSSSIRVPQRRGSNYRSVVAQAVESARSTSTSPRPSGACSKVSGTTCSATSAPTMSADRP